MRAEIIASGSELLLGEVVDTNSTFIAHKLREIGLNLYFKTVVGDNELRMAAALHIALDRADVIITTGGLGPTVDDVTRPAVARAAGRGPVFRQDLMDQIAARFRAYGSPMGENNRRQAYVPAGAMPIENPVGTAPSFIVEHAGKLIISLPGVPREMEYLLVHNVLPYLQNKLDLHEVMVVRTLHTVGLGESRVDALIGTLETASNPTVGLSAKAGQVDIRITAKATTSSEAAVLIAAMEQQVREKLQDQVYGVDDETLEAVVMHMLSERHLTLASAEFGTDGKVAGRLSSVRDNPMFAGGQVLAHPETVDLDAVVQVAQAASRSYGSDLGLAAMLHPAPDGSGLKYYSALVDGDRRKTIERGFGGHAGLAAQWASTSALGLVWRYLRSET